MSKIERLFGGGESWWYAIEDDKIVGSAHEDDLEGMKKLRELCKENKNVG